MYFPDLSSYTPVSNINPATEAVVCRAVAPGSKLDSYYPNCRAQCAHLGIPFAAYVWVNAGNISHQVDYAISVVGTNVAIMLDCEDMVGDTGYNGVVSVTDIVNFVKGIRAKGGICNVVYLPHWYWHDHMGSPDLSPLVNLNVYLVSSYYATYSDTGPGWNAYGGMTPTFWQFTSSSLYQGLHVDMNAFRGTESEWVNIWYGGSDMALEGYVSVYKDGGTRPEGLALSEVLSTVLWGKTVGNGQTIVGAISDKIDTLTASVAGMSSVLSDTDRQLIVDLTTAIKSLEAVFKAAGNAVG